MDIREARKQTKQYRNELNLQDGDTVICSTGTGTLGRVGQVYGDYPKTTFDSHVTLVRAKQAAGKHYLFWTLKNMEAWFISAITIAAGTIAILKPIADPGIYSFDRLIRRNNNAPKSTTDKRSSRTNEML